jgi:adenosylmethionine-8-amino-7-oxononanoate aminotransferase
VIAKKVYRVINWSKAQIAPLRLLAGRSLCGSSPHRHWLGSVDLAEVAGLVIEPLIQGAAGMRRWPEQPKIEHLARKLDRLSEFPNVREVRRCGFIAGIEIQQKKWD